MIRHGQASFGKENYDELSDLGRRQSRILGKNFMSSGILLDAIYSGTLARQSETVREFLSAYGSGGIKLPKILKTDAFNEHDSEGVLRGLIPVFIKENPGFEKDVERMLDDNRSFQKVFEAVMLRWVSNDYDNPELRKWEDFIFQVEQGIKNIMANSDRGKNVALFTSGGPIAVAVRKALNLTNTDTIKVSWQVVNTSVSCFKYTKNRFMLSTFNEHAHFEKGLITYR